MNAEADEAVVEVPAAAEEDAPKGLDAAPPPKGLAGAAGEDFAAEPKTLVVNPAAEDPPNPNDVTAAVVAAVVATVGAAVVATVGAAVGAVAAPPVFSRSSLSASCALAYPAFALAKNAAENPPEAGAGFDSGEAAAAVAEAVVAVAAAADEAAPGKVKVASAGAEPKGDAVGAAEDVVVDAAAEGAAPAKPNAGVDVDAGASPNAGAEDTAAVEAAAEDDDVAADEAPTPKEKDEMDDAVAEDAAAVEAAAVEAAAAGAALLFNSSSSASCALEYPALAFAKNAAENPPVAAGLGFSSFSSFVSSFVSSFFFSAGAAAASSAFCAAAAEEAAPAKVNPPDAVAPGNLNVDVDADAGVRPNAGAVEAAAEEADAAEEAPTPKENPPPAAEAAAVEAAAAGAALLFSSSSSASCALEYPALAFAKNAAENPPVAAGLGFSSFSSFSSFFSAAASGFFSSSFSAVAAVPKLEFDGAAFSAVDTPNAEKAAEVAPVPDPKLNPPVAGAEPSDRPNPPTAAVEAAAVEAAAAGAALLFSSSSSASCALEYPAFALAKNAAENPPVAAGMGFSFFASASVSFSSSASGFFSSFSAAAGAGAPKLNPPVGFAAPNDAVELAPKLGPAPNAGAAPKEVGALPTELKEVGAPPTAADAPKTPLQVWEATRPPWGATS